MNLFRTLSFCVALLLLASSPLAQAQTALPEAISAILEKAAERDAAEGTNRFLDTAVILSIDTYPDLSASILGKASELAPERREAISALVAPTFPRLDGAAAPAVTAAAEPIAEPAAPPTEEPSVLTGFFSWSGWDGEVELGAGLNSGNTDEQSVTAGFKLVNDREKWRHEFKTLLDFTRADGTTTKQDLQADYQLDYKFNDRLYVFGLLSYEDKRFSGFDYRTIETLGIGYKALEGETYFLNIEGGPTARQSKVSITGMTETEVGARINTVFHWDVSESFSIENTASALFAEDSTTLEETIALQSKLTHSLSGRLSFNIQHNTNVPDGSKKTDTVTRATLLYSF